MSDIRFIYVSVPSDEAACAVCEGEMVPPHCCNETITRTAIYFLTPKQFTVLYA